MRFPKGKSIFGGSDFSKFSRFPPQMGGKYLIFPPHTPPEWGGKRPIFPPQTPPEWGGNNVQKSIYPPHGGEKRTPGLILCKPKSQPEISWKPATQPKNWRVLLFFINFRRILRGNCWNSGESQPKLLKFRVYIGWMFTLSLDKSSLHTNSRSVH